MIATIFHSGKEYKVDFFKPLDISMPLSSDENSTRAWYLDPIKIEAVVMGNWIGDVNRGGSVNFKTITFNPHAHGTHTEGVGHISKEFYSVNRALNRFFYIAELITVLPKELENGDFVITAAQMESALNTAENTEAIVIRTLGNGTAKLHTNYSNTNPPYLLKETIDVLNKRNIKHLLIDMPSVDKESDGGKLEAHHAFWEYPENTQTEKTITELIYVPNEIKDGTYLLNLQFAPFENDASPSKPILYQIY